MKCCLGNKSGVSQPGVSHDAVTRTLLADRRGAAERKAIVNLKEPSVPVSTEAAPLATITALPAAPAEKQLAASVERQPAASEKQHAPHEAEQSNDMLHATNDIVHSQHENETDHIQNGRTNTASSGTHSAGLLRKQRTVVVDKNELDVMVVEYSCHDSSVLTALGKHCKEARWKVQMGHDVDPVDIKLHVDKGVASGPAVHVTSNETTVFKAAGSYTRKAMYDDFEQRWPFRGNIKGLNEPDMFEFHPHASGAANQWFPATIIGQLPNGLFEVVAMMPDSYGGVKQESYPAVDMKDLREVGTHNPLQRPERCLTLQVPRDDPLQACFSLDGQDLVTHHFARPSPSPAGDNHGQKKQLELCVAKDRSTVTGNVGHAVLSHFVSGEVQSIDSDVQRLKHSWTIQLGPFAEHKIVVEKKYTLGKVVSLTVDDKPFVEATAEDIDCFGAGWECKFRFVGERILDFEVHESNRDGVTLDSKAHVMHKRKYVHECCVTLGEDMDVRRATFTVDSKDFKELPVRPLLHDEASISISPKAFRDTYGIHVPYKVNLAAPCGILGFSVPQAAGAKTKRRVRSICC